MLALMGLLTVSAQGGGGPLFFSWLAYVLLVYSIFLVVGVAVARAAERHARNGVLWGLTVFLIPVVGLLLYMVVRTQEASRMH